MTRYWRIYRTFFVSSFARELEFRANFFAKLLQNASWIFFFLLIILVIYSRTEKVAGWTQGEAIVLAGTIFLLNAIGTAFFMSLMEIPQQVRQGTLDFIITKPVDTQFWISLRKFNFDQIGTLFAGAIMVTAGVINAGHSPGFLQIVAYIALVFSALIIFYSFNLALMTLGIWLVRVDNLWVLSESIIQVARFPTDIYGAAMQRVFTYFLPLAFLATIPSRQLARGFDPLMLALGVVWAIVFFFFARWFWGFALKHYTSASS